jgi:hypothetical protein
MAQEARFALLCIQAPKEILDQINQRLSPNVHSTQKIQKDILLLQDNLRLANFITHLKSHSGPRADQFLAHFLSSKSDTFTWNCLPCGPTLFTENDQYKIALALRLLLPHYTLKENDSGLSGLYCKGCEEIGLPLSEANVAGVKDFDEHMYHAIRCSSKGQTNKTLLIHNPLVQAFAQMLRSTGFRVSTEPRHSIVGTDTFTDLLIRLEDGTSIHADVRICDPLLKSNLPLSTSVPGHANNRGQIEKDRKFYDIVHSQGDQFIPLCHEHPGCMGAPAVALVDRCAERFSTSRPQQAVFKSYWLSILHFTVVKGTADLVKKHLPCYPASNPLSTFTPMRTLPIAHSVVPSPILYQA